MNEPKPIQPASTILLVRDGTAGLEVFMVVRHHQIDFASGALVFPGGKVDPDDHAEGALAMLDGAISGLEAFQIAAIREAFEECGVLLARRSGSDELIAGADLAGYAELRLDVQASRESFIDFLQREELRLAGDLLVPFAHWITPEMVPRRFDTHFFVAMAPTDHLAIHDGHESVDSIWITPRAAIEDARTGRRTVIFPTLRNIEMLGEAPNAEAAVERARQRDVVTVLPRTEQRADGMYLCIPPEAGYAISAEKMPDRRS